MAIPKVAAIHDLSGLGKCSLTAAIPILAVCGVQAVPMPTAVLSNQTAFESYTGADLSIYMPMIAEEWKKRRAEFQGIFTGYLSSEQEVKWVEGFIDEFRKEDTLILVDPVLGDEGKFYRGFGDEMCCAMRNLCKKADVITPNLTEALFLLGKDAALVEQGEPLEIVEQYANIMRKNSIMQDELRLCKGARIMITRNIEKDVVNGSLGYVTEISGNDNEISHLVVKIDNYKEITVIPVKEELYDHKGNKLIEMHQYPCKLAYSASVHKMQGCTLSECFIDFARFFEVNQAYVALSRVKTLNGLYVKNLTRQSIKFSDKVLEFQKTL